MNDRKNIAEIHEMITTNFAHKLKDYNDSAAFAYLDAMMTALKERGEDPTQYELQFVESEYPEYVEEGDSAKMIVRKRLQLRRIASNDNPRAAAQRDEAYYWHGVLSKPFIDGAERLQEVKNHMAVRAAELHAKVMGTDQ